LHLFVALEDIVPKLGGFAPQKNRTLNSTKIPEPVNENQSGGGEAPPFVVKVTGFLE
jgi:hypothetical protein